MENEKNLLDYTENTPLPAAVQNVAESPEDEQELEYAESEVEAEVSPSPTPIIVVSDGYRETFDTPIEDMQPITLIIAFLVLLLTVLYVVKGVDYGEFS